MSRLLEVKKEVTTVRDSLLKETREQQAKLDVINSQVEGLSNVIGILFYPIYVYHLITRRVLKHSSKCLSLFLQKKNLKNAMMIMPWMTSLNHSLLLYHQQSIIHNF